MGTQNNTVDALQTRPNDGYASVRAPRILRPEFTLGTGLACTGRLSPDRSGLLIPRESAARADRYATKSA
jgi:hypothetical protein